MNRRGGILGLLSGGIALFAGRQSVSAKAAGKKRYRAVFDLSAESPEKWEAALRSIETLCRTLGPENVEVELVVHEKAYPLLQRTNAGMENRLRALSDVGVHLSMCRNTMRRFGVTLESLFSFARTVDAAVAELVRRQEEGFAYLKAGV